MKIHRMTNKEYHEHEAISKTKLDMFHRDPGALEWMKSCPVDEKKMKTLDFGDAMHSICLEPDRFKSEFVCAPKFNLRTNQGKADRFAFEEENKGKKILESDEYKKLNLMFESVMAHPVSRRLIEADGIAEGSVFWKDKETGVECKCRPDKLIPKQELLIDIKTTQTLKDFKYSVEDYRYYVQEAFYCDGMAENLFSNCKMVFLVIQKTIELGRYPVAVYSLPDEVVEYGRSEYKKDLDLYVRTNGGESGGDFVDLELHPSFLKRIDYFVLEGVC